MARVQIAVATLSGNSLRQTVHTHRASVHQAAKSVAALLRVARVTAGLAESNGSLPPGLWLTSPAGWLPRAGVSSGTLRSAVEYGLPLPFHKFCLFSLYFFCCLLSMCCACYRSWWNNHYHRIIIIIIVVSTTTTNCLVCRDCSHRATGPYVCMCVHVVTFVLKELWPRPPYSIYLPWCFTLTHCHRSKLTVVGVMNEISPFLAMDARWELLGRWSVRPRVRTF